MTLNPSSRLSLIYSLALLSLSSCGDDEKVVPNVQVPDWYKEEGHEAVDEPEKELSSAEKTPLSISFNMLYSRHRAWPPEKQHSNLDAPEIHDWAVYTGSPVYNHTIRKDSGKLLKIPLKIGSFGDGMNYPCTAHAFNSKFYQSPLVPALYADVKNGLQPNEGYTVGIKVPQAAQAGFKLTTYFVAFRSDALIRIRKTDGTVLQEFACPWEESAYHALQATIKGAQPGSLLYVDVLLSQAKPETKGLPQIGIGLNGMKVESL
ncbi:hypothetical protein SAMN02745181_0628 [Rubritalea squalenifaciens DSM 18772]|uniref:Uncharacterized protein n=1 Tax=Rubritalea squalenifaciens DSM 18772 TaxID=1123071 RepID=A0A1M6D2J1_9BACT|nr:hypothetical protein [Rubritalea squalenifaciens]SHI67409.1 hypothetical protein SAMN02745181_0628 [Rubritalea squalenifaciens DSM 18772]